MNNLFNKLWNDFLVFGTSCMLITAATIVPVKAQETAKIVEAFAKISPSIGALYAQQGDGNLKFLCSATAVDRIDGKTVILTAYHCMDKGVGYMINFGDNKLRPLTVYKIPHYEVDPAKFPRRFNEPKTDMAMLLMDGEDIPLVPLADDDTLKAGSKVVMMGYPLGVAKISYEGSVAGKYDRVGQDMYNYTLLQIFGAPGSSGSAVVDLETGKVVSILVAAKHDVGLPVIFATPIEYKKHLMEVMPKEEKGGDK